MALEHGELFDLRLGSGVEHPAHEENCNHDTDDADGHEGDTEVHFLDDDAECHKRQEGQKRDIGLELLVSEEQPIPLLHNEIEVTIEVELAREENGQ